MKNVMKKLLESCGNLLENLTTDFSYSSSVKPLLSYP